MLSHKAAPCGATAEDETSHSGWAISLGGRKDGSARWGSWSRAMCSEQAHGRHLSRCVLLPCRCLRVSRVGSDCRVGRALDGNLASIQFIHIY